MKQAGEEALFHELLFLPLLLGDFAGDEPSDPGMTCQDVQGEAVGGILAVL